MDGDHHSALPYDDHQMLSTEQQKVVELIDLGKNVFFTGAAGNPAHWCLVFIRTSQWLLCRYRQKLPPQIHHQALKIEAERRCHYCYDRNF